MPEIISKEQYEYCLTNNIPYTGYIKGVGYASLIYGNILPPTYGLFNPPGRMSSYNDTFCMPFYSAVIESSPYLIAKSYDINTEDVVQALTTISKGYISVYLGKGQGVTVPVDESTVIINLTDTGSELFIEVKVTSKTLVYPRANRIDLLEFISDYKTAQGKLKFTDQTDAFKDVLSVEKNKLNAVADAVNHFRQERGVIKDNNQEQGDASGLGLAFAGAGLTAGEVKMFNANSWYSLKQMKTYSQSFNGNGYTGGKIAHAQTISTTLKWTGRALGAYNALSINDQYTSGELSNDRMVIEQGSNLYSTFGGIYGAAWGVGWELGRTISTFGWYQDFKQNTWYPWRQEHLGY
jgi:hypothetical protein